MSAYFDIYMNQLFTTLGQLSAVIISGAVAVPVASYYGKDIFNMFNWNKKQNVSPSRINGDFFVDGDIHCSGDVLAFYKSK